ncbi:hypothetical protein PTKIN_Ptkin16aG0533800 [Pterospermum kingtungense]
MGGAISTYGDVYSYGVMLLEMFTGKKPTDDMFKNGSNLHNFAKNAIPEQAMEVLDPSMPLEEAEEGLYKFSSNGRDKLEQIIVSILKIGVTCSADQPRNRMNMREVSRSLQAVKDRMETMYFIADSEKEKEDWINSIGRSIVQHSRSVTDSEIVDYDSKR